MHAYKHTETCTSAHIDTDIHVHTHIQIHIHIHMHVHAYAYANTYQELFWQGAHHGLFRERLQLVFARRRADQLICRKRRAFQDIVLLDGFGICNQSVKSQLHLLLLFREHVACLVGEFEVAGVCRSISTANNGLKLKSVMTMVAKTVVKN